MVEEPRLRPRIRVVVGTAVGCVILMAGTFLLGLNIRGSDQQAYENSERTVMAVATVETHSLSPVTSTGTAIGGAEILITATTPVGATIAQVTQTPIPVGEIVKPGAVLVGLSNRPVFALPLNGPSYRDLVVNDYGPDVVALNGALGRLGYDVSAESEDYDWDTVRAIAKLYKDHDFEAERAPNTETPTTSETAPVATNSTPSPSAAPAPAAPIVMARGTKLPFAEVKNVSDPNMVISRELPLLATAKDGDEVLMLSSSVGSVTTRLNALDVRRIVPGSAVHLVVQGSGTQIDGSVATVGQFQEATADTSGANAAAAGYDVTVSLSAEALGKVKAGEKLALTFGQEETPSLAVPSSALNQDGADTFVWVKEADEYLRRNVEVTQIADGWALLKDPAPLNLGDTIRLG